MDVKQPIRLTAGELVSHLRGYGSGTPVKIVGAGSDASVSFQNGTVVIELSRAPFMETPAEIAAELPSDVESASMRVVPIKRGRK